MTNNLVNLGLWIMQKWKKSTSLLQLCLKDNVDPYKTFIYNLSKDCKMHLFKYVLLCGSSQDHYVPRHSAHIQICNQSLQDYSSTGQCYRDMINNIMKSFLSRNDETKPHSNNKKSIDVESIAKDAKQPVNKSINEQISTDLFNDLKFGKCNELMRFDVWHPEAGGTNSLIGRQAHIAVLDCELFIEKFMTIVGLKYFA